MAQSVSRRDFAKLFAVGHEKAKRFGFTVVEIPQVNSAVGRYLKTGI
jgi:hypothetical protein